MQDYMTRIANLELDNKELKNKIKKLERAIWTIQKQSAENTKK